MRGEAEHLFHVLSVYLPYEGQSQHTHEAVDGACPDGRQLALIQVQASVPEDEGGVVHHLVEEARC